VLGLKRSDNQRQRDIWIQLFQEKLYETKQNQILKITNVKKTQTYMQTNKNKYKDHENKSININNSMELES
jgi:hypothetical protein